MIKTLVHILSINSTQIQLVSNTMDSDIMCLPKGLNILQPDFWQRNPNLSFQILESDKLYLPYFSLKTCQWMSS